MRAAILIPIVALVLVGCGSEADDSAAPSPTTAPSAAAPASTSTGATASPTPVATPDDAQQISITVTGGEVSGDTGRVEVALGETVRFTVTADVADEIHVHGYDLTADTVPGQPAVIEFIADQPGVFDIEMHDSRTVLTRLQVQ